MTPPYLLQFVLFHQGWVSDRLLPSPPFATRDGLFLGIFSGDHRRKRELKQGKLGLNPAASILSHCPHFLF
jgi:hypothetical protein